MRVLVIGAGVLGCNIAANLYKAQKDVTLLARGNWHDQIKLNGLCIRDYFVPWTKTYPVKLISSLEPDDIYDAIFVSVQFIQIPSLYESLNRNGSKNIIFNGNNTRVDDVIQNLPEKNVMFSFSISAGSRKEDYIHSIDLNKITIGDVKGKNNEDFIRSLLQGTKYKIVYQPNMKDYLLCHAAFVVPAVFACYYTNGNLKKIKKDEVYLQKIIQANVSCYRALDRLGVEILPSEDQAYDSFEWYKKMQQFYKLMCSTPLGKICASDHAMNAPKEMHALAMDMKELLVKANVDSSVFDALWKPLARRMRMEQIQQHEGNKEEYSSKYIEKLEDSPLENKNVLFLGSSVTFGAGSLEDGISEYFQQRFGCHSIKEAVSGTTLVDEDESSYVARLHDLVDVHTPFSLVIVQLSTNDATKNLSLGTISDTLPYDTTTITGAMEYIISYCQTTWNCPVLFYTGSHYESEAYENMVVRLFELARKWNIGVLDLWHDKEFNTLTDEQRALYMVDPIHPTKAGYMKWWCPEIEKQLLNYII